MSEKECQYDRIYEKTIDFDRPQFVKELQMQINDNKKKDKEIERLNNIIDEIHLLFIEFDRNVMKRKYVEANMINLKIKAKLKELKEGK